MWGGCSERFRMEIRFDTINNQSNADTKADMKAKMSPQWTIFGAPSKAWCF